MKITLDPESYWSYYDYIAAQLKHIMAMADGGQQQLRGTDTQSPALKERAAATIAAYENISQKIANLTLTLKQNANL
jgi:hypothetical protein